MKLNNYCISTHGGSGYVEGTYWDGDALICGGCGARIENPAPTGGRWVHEVGLRGWFGKGHWEPTFPKWLGGKKGVPHEAAE